MHVNNKDWQEKTSSGLVFTFKSPVRIENKLLFRLEIECPLISFAPTAKNVPKTLFTPFRYPALAYDGARRTLKHGDIRY